jgi:hypothetical protein
VAVRKHHPARRKKPHDNQTSLELAKIFSSPTVLPGGRMPPYTAGKMPATTILPGGKNIRRRPLFPPPNPVHPVNPVKIQIPSPRDYPFPLSRGSRISRFKFPVFCFAVK